MLERRSAGVFTRRGIGCSMLDDKVKNEVAAALVSVVGDRHLEGAHAIICLMEAAAFIMSRTCDDVENAITRGLPTVKLYLDLSFLQRVPEIMERLASEKAEQKEPEVDAAGA